MAEQHIESFEVVHVVSKLKVEEVGHEGPPFSGGHRHDLHINGLGAQPFVFDSRLHNAKSSKVGRSTLFCLLFC